MGDILAMSSLVKCLQIVDSVFLWDILTRTFRWEIWIDVISFCNQVNYFCCIGLIFAETFLLYEFHKQKNFNIKYYFTRLWPYFAVIAVFIPVAFVTQNIDITSKAYITTPYKYYKVLFNMFWLWSLWFIRLDIFYRRRNLWSFDYWNSKKTFIISYHSSSNVKWCWLRRNDIKFIYNFF